MLLPASRSLPCSVSAAAQWAGLQKSRAVSQGWGRAAEGAGAELSSCAPSWGCPESLIPLPQSWRMPRLKPCMEQGSTQPLQETRMLFLIEFSVFAVENPLVRASQLRWLCLVLPESPKQSLILRCDSLASWGERKKSSPFGTDANIKSQITWQRAVIQRRSQHPPPRPGGSVLFIFPGTCPAPLALSLAFQVSSARSVCASTDCHVCPAHCRGPLAFQPTNHCGTHRATAAGAGWLQKLLTMQALSVAG